MPRILADNEQGLKTPTRLSALTVIRKTKS